MKKVSIYDIPTVAASHEDPKNPGSFKNLLFTQHDVTSGTHLQMINWATIPKGKSFRPHYHEDMDEIFIIFSGKVRIRIENEEDILEEGEGVCIPMKHVHEMTNIGNSTTKYLAIGFSLQKGGRTILVMPKK